MMTATGEIQTYLDALGMDPNDPALTAILDLPGPTTDTNEQREADGNVVFHLAARSNGTEFMFSHQRLVAVFIGTQPRESWGVYPRLDRIIDGLKLDDFDAYELRLAGAIEAGWQLHKGQPL